MTHLATWGANVHLLSSLHACYDDWERLGPANVPMKQSEIGPGKEGGSMMRWKPGEIIVHEKLKKDPVAAHFIHQCPSVPVRYTDADAGIASKIVQRS